MARVLWALFVSAVVLYTIVVSPGAVIGFKRKRALFGGGVTPEGDEPLLWRKSSRTDWQTFPRGNVYDAEADVFALLGVRPPREFAVDIFLSPVPYFLLWGWSLIAVQSLEGGDWGSLATFAGLAVVVVFTRGRVFKRRRAGHESMRSVVAKPERPFVDRPR